MGDIKENQKCIFLKLLKKINDSLLLKIFIFSKIEDIIILGIQY